jgi:hypothetical protein
MTLGREYWFNYRVPGFLAIVWFCSSSTPPPRAPSPLPSVGPTGDTQENWEREGERSQIIRRRVCLVLYKSFNTLWLQVTITTVLRWRHVRFLAHVYTFVYCSRGSSLLSSLPCWRSSCLGRRECPRPPPRPRPPPLLRPFSEPSEPPSSELEPKTSSLVSRWPEPSLLPPAPGRS